MAAHAQGKFWAYADRVFASGKLDVLALEAVAREVGLDVEKWKAELGGGVHREAVKADVDLALRFQVREIGRAHV